MYELTDNIGKDQEDGLYRGQLRQPASTFWSFKSSDSSHEQHRTIVVGRCAASLIYMYRTANDVSDQKNQEDKFRRLSCFNVT